MTEAEVEEIIGCPPGVYTDRRSVSWVYRGIGPPPPHSRWVGYEGVAWVELTSDEPRRVSHKGYSPFPPESYTDRCRWVLNRARQAVGW